MFDYIAMKDKVENWVGEVAKLSSIVNTHPQELEAHGAFTHGLTSKWTYFLCMNDPKCSQNTDAIRYKLIPAITGKIRNQ